ncbi:MAG: PAS domain-containing sensor histidine kinase [Saprospiraceae bacterium]|nr:PAS domain-containing sensor histidine kinase [Saprospiraceae bacterium]
MPSTSNHQNILDSVFESAIDGVIVIDHQGIIQRINKSACQLFGYIKEELLFKNIHVLVPSPHHEHHNQYIQNYLQTGVKKIMGIGRDVYGKRKDGTQFPIRLSISEFKIAEDIFFTGVIHDQTEQKLTEQKLQDLARNLETMVQARTSQLQETIHQLIATNKNLEEEIDYRKVVERKLINREKELIDSLEKERDLGILKSRFVSIASHEFRTPLANILSSISLVHKYDSPELLEKRNIHIEKIKKNIHYLNGILNEFLTIARIEEGKFELRLNQFNIAELIEDIVEDFSLWKKKGQKIIFRYDKDADQLNYSDPSCLKHILHNILSNAIKYSNDDTTILIVLEKKLNEFEIIIEDEGIGIPTNEMKHIFDIFFRGTNVLNIQGTGLGLNIVKKYLDSIGGRIRFQHRQPNGTKVILNLPEYVKTI